MTDLNSIVDWFHRKRRAAASEGEVLEIYFQHHPRTSFLKMLAQDAKVVDIGAGDGSLSVFRSWPRPKRADLKMYAYSIEKGSHFDQFEDYRLSDWNKEMPVFDGVRFDAAVSAHFIEHIREPESIVDWLKLHLVDGGRAYVEWPSPNSIDLPSRHALIDAGVELIISRFDDDDTHRAGLPDRAAMCSAFRENGFEIEQEGVIRMPWIEEQLMATQRDNTDRFPRQAAFWLMTGWSQYLIARKIQCRLSQ
ncbi:MAG: methyltransferase domain-containing protein [Lysobacter sp.]|nr:methyltransferase domain-containing protein [Lysobacter sp.]